MSESERGANRSADAPANRGASTLPPWLIWLGKWVTGFVGLMVAGALGVLLLIAVALAVAYPNLPETSSLTDYRPKLPMRIYSSDSVLIGEFGDRKSVV